MANRILSGPNPGSPDDQPWSPGDTGAFLTLRGVASDDVDLIAVGDGGLLLRSTDGLDWTTETSPTDEELLAITFGPRGFVAVASVETIAVSADSVDGRARDGLTSEGLVYAM